MNFQLPVVASFCCFEDQLKIYQDIAISDLYLAQHRFQYQESVLQATSSGHYFKNLK